MTVVANLVSEFYTKFPSIWYIESFVWTDKHEREVSERLKEELM